MYIYIYIYIYILCTNAQLLWVGTDFDNVMTNFVGRGSKPHGENNYCTYEDLRRRYLTLARNI